MLTSYARLNVRGTLHSEPRNISTIVFLTEKELHFYFGNR